MSPNEHHREHVVDGLSRGWMLFGLGLIALMNAIVYRYQLQETNSSAGYEPINWDTAFIMRLMIGLVLVSSLIPTGLRRPSDVFQLLYGLFVPISYAIFHEISGSIDTIPYVSRLAMLCLPMILVWLATQIDWKFPTIGILTNNNLIAILVMASALVAITAILLGPKTSGFSLDETYVRRLEGRETFPAGSILAYVSMITANGIAPFLAFIGALTGYRWLLIFSITIGICFFFVIGLKAPLAFIVLAYLFGYGLKLRSPSMFHRSIFWILTLTFLLFIYEMVFTEEYSLVAAELIYRRTFTVPAHVLTHYFDLMFGDNSIFWSLSVGVGDNAPEGVAFLVGNLYYDSDIANVNTSAFIVALASGGLLQSLMALTLITMVLVLLDAIYAKTNSHLCMGVAFIYSILLSEQAATTVLVSSGIGILLMFVMISGDNFQSSISTTESLPTVKPGSNSDLNGLNRTT